MKTNQTFIFVPIKLKQFHKLDTSVHFPKVGNGYVVRKGDSVIQWRELSLTTTTNLGLIDTFEMKSSQ